MRREGWEFDLSERDQRHDSFCDPTTFWGYKYGKAIGIVKVSFRGTGNATLKFGQCYSNSDSGVTEVYLNDYKIKSANFKDGPVTVSFIYRPHDILKLKELYTGIIQISSLQLTCEGL